MDSRHPLVIVLVIAVIGVGFYYIASPYENCMRENSGYGVRISDTRYQCNGMSNW